MTVNQQIAIYLAIYLLSLGSFSIGVWMNESSDPSPNWIQGAFMLWLICGGLAAAVGIITLIGRAVFP